MNLTEAQRRMLRAIDTRAAPQGGWAEVELEFISHSSVPQYLESITCFRVGEALRRKGLIEEDGGPVLTAIGVEALQVGRIAWRRDGTLKARDDEASVSP